VNPGVYAQDTNRLRALVTKIWRAHKGDSTVLPIVVGPASNLAQLVPYVLSLEPATIEAYTYHQYPQCMPGKIFALEPSCLIQLDSVALEARSLVEGLNPGQEFPLFAWAGEGADHTAYGMDKQLWLAEFRSSFYYAWQLAALPLAGVPTAARQTLTGGNYGLLNHTNMFPNPDYWIALMYRNLYGPILDYTPTFRYVDQSVSELESGVRVFCVQNEKVTTIAYVIVNLGPEEYDVDLMGPGQTWNRTEWHFMGKNNEIDTHFVTLNGHLLAMKNNIVPNLASLGIPGNAKSPVNVGGYSITFVVQKA
jgi:hypothetical protein